MAGVTSMSYDELAEVWRGLLVAEDYLVIPEGFDDVANDPRALLTRARALVEVAMQRAGEGSPGFREL